MGNDLWIVEHTWPGASWWRSRPMWVSTINRHSTWKEKTFFRTVLKSWEFRIFLFKEEPFWCDIVMRSGKLWNESQATHVFRGSYCWPRNLKVFSLIRNPFSPWASTSFWIPKQPVQSKTTQKKLTKTDKTTALVSKISSRQTIAVLLLISYRCHIELPHWQWQGWVHQ